MEDIMSIVRKYYPLRGTVPLIGKSKYVDCYFDRKHGIYNLIREIENSNANVVCCFWCSSPEYIRFPLKNPHGPFYKIFNVSNMFLNSIETEYDHIYLCSEECCLKLINFFNVSITSRDDEDGIVSFKVIDNYSIYKFFSKKNATLPEWT